MKILYAASEATPFAKSGGLADVVGALSPVLKAQGADVRVIESTAIINGVERLVGARVNATDLRAGAAMVIAALMAEGTTEISGVSYILRGYERFDEKLRRLGAQVERIVCPEDDF